MKEEQYLEQLEQRVIRAAKGEPQMLMAALDLVRTREAQYADLRGAVAEYREADKTFVSDPSRFNNAKRRLERAITLFE